MKTYKTSRQLKHSSRKYGDHLVIFIMSIMENLFVYNIESLKLQFLYNLYKIC